ncbi:MAG: 3-oxoacyl-ACP reductase FabG [Saprospiraceae bacterium]|nr:3-oxoacyl-ACP reductase FabG [Saprospiraceae bacterium]
MKHLLLNKNAFVSGGSRGIGAAIVRAFAAAGANVGFSWLNSQAEAETLVRELTDTYGVKVMAWQCDVSQAAEVETTLTAFIREFGSIDILVNNAGRLADKLICDISMEEWRNTQAINLDAAFFHTQFTLRYMIPQRNGVLLHIGSVVGAEGNAGQAAYAASKSALIGLNRSIAKEVGPRNIRSNLISPGMIETDLSAPVREKIGPELKKNIPLRRFGLPEEVANLAVFLASDQAAYITGQEISVCGGYT